MFTSFDFIPHEPHPPVFAEWLIMLHSEYHLILRAKLLTYHKKTKQIKKKKKQLYMLNEVNALSAIRM